MKKSTFAWFEAACAALLIVTYMTATEYGVLLIGGLILLLDAGIRALKSRHEPEE